MHQLGHCYALCVINEREVKCVPAASSFFLLLLFSSPSQMEQGASLSRSNRPDPPLSLANARNRVADLNQKYVLTIFVITITVHT
jgi:hypothetical protein